MMHSVTYSLLLSWTLGVASQSINITSFDYIIAGGGTAGLAVANRLSEVSNVSVLVIEAGTNNVTSWDYPGVPQKYAGDRKETYPSGKALGGSSRINGKVYLRAEDIQIDLWEKAGSPGWNWDSLWQYYKKSEELEEPSQQALDTGITYNPAFHGHGPVHVSFSRNQGGGNYLRLLNESYQSLGIPYLLDPNGGNMRGLSTFPKTWRNTGNNVEVRESSFTAYLQPIENRSNLYVLTNTTVLRILWALHSTLDHEVAIGVEVLAADGSVETFNATREVILSAGAYKSCVILEYSGVGNPQVLSKYDIPTRISLPGVGENFQDQTNDRILFNWSGTPPSGAFSTVAYLNVQDLFGNETESFASSIHKELPKYASMIASQNNNAVSASEVLGLLQLQYSLIFEQKMPMMELLKQMSLGSPLICEFWNAFPLSRGNVHINSSDPLSAPAINPNFFMTSYDLQVQIAAARFIRRLYAAPPVSGLVANETSPGLNTVSVNGDISAWEKWINTDFRSAWHPVGTTSLLPRQLGGVVDERLKVYGTANVRVVDAGIVPFQINGHTSSVAYAVAEKGSDFIKQDASLANA